MAQRDILLRSCILSLAAVALIALIPDSDAQTQIGGVSIDGEWYVGEGLKKGDYFSYTMCHVNYKECKEFQMDFWIKGEIQVGNERKLLVPTVVYDGNKVIKGVMELGKVAPEPTGGSQELLPYRSAFKSSVVWLSAFATSYGGSGGEGPKKFDAPSWGKIANIGGEQILPTSVQRITVQGGTFEESILMSWRTGGAQSRVFIVDEFPFPVQAQTFVHVSEGIPPLEYKFELRDYDTKSSDPFVNVVPTKIEEATKGCPVDPDLVKHRSSTKDNLYVVNVQYGPEKPVAGCDMTMIVKFLSKFDNTEFLNQVQYDIIVTDVADNQLYKVSEAEGVRVLFSPTGQTRNDELRVPSQAGDYVYAIVVHGLAPINSTPTTLPDVLRVPITVVPNPQQPTASRPDPTPEPEPAQKIPSWIKRTTGVWVDGHSTDAEFVNAIEFLISEGVIAVGSDTGSEASSGSSIPSWIKRTAGFWVDGHSTDAEFVSAIEFLVERGVIVVNR